MSSESEREKERERGTRADGPNFSLWLHARSQLNLILPNSHQTWPTLTKMRGNYNDYQTSITGITFPNLLLNMTICLHCDFDFLVFSRKITCYGYNSESILATVINYFSY